MGLILPKGVQSVDEIKEMAKINEGAPRPESKYKGEVKITDIYAHSGYVVIVANDGVEEHKEELTGEEAEERGKKLLTFARKKKYASDKRRYTRMAEEFLELSREAKRQYASLFSTVATAGGYKAGSRGNCAGGTTNPTEPKKASNLILPS